MFTADRNDGFQWAEIFLPDFFGHFYWAAFSPPSQPSPSMGKGLSPHPIDRLRMSRAGEKNDFSAVFWRIWVDFDTFGGHIPGAVPLIFSHEWTRIFTNGGGKKFRHFRPFPAIFHRPSGTKRSRGKETSRDIRTYFQDRGWRAGCQGAGVSKLGIGNWGFEVPVKTGRTGFGQRNGFRLAPE